MTSRLTKEYFNAINHKLSEVKNSLAEFECYLALNDRRQKVERAMHLIGKLSALREMFDPADLPKWVKPFSDAISKYATEGESTDTSSQIVTAVGKFHPQVHLQTWDYLSEENHFPVAAEIADHTYKNSKFPDLFERLAQQIEDAINSGDIDSNKAIKRLQELVRLIRKNARASFYSVSYMITFGFRGIKNVIKAYGLAYLGPLGEGIQATVKEMDEDWPKLQAEIHEKITEAYRASMPSVDSLPGPFDPLESDELIQILQAEPLRIEDQSQKDTGNSEN